MLLEFIEFKGRITVSSPGLKLNSLIKIIHVSRLHIYYRSTKNSPWLGR